MEEIHDILIRKYIDRTFKTIDKSTLNWIDSLPPHIALVMVMRMGKALLEEDEWNEITKKMRKSLWEKLRERFSTIYRRVSKMQTRVGAKSKISKAMPEM